ncbi:hypothetical protein M413DRAFT_366735 [Hebeloma cylindrosporum]|uniref:C2H2-type domain-containing protein n=1 Tax=Hebeloma cylindrosporum TaxID=76867 RepID=A0A0C3CLE2_HEBCY|nr:hypothetical protein M413DRAFT_366735 [Hebeloma cylindrosporum h7]
MASQQGRLAASRALNSRASALKYLLSPIFVHNDCFPFLPPNMPAVRKQRAEKDTAQTQTSLSRVPCPFPDCKATVSKPADLKRHYMIHFPEWQPYQCPWYHTCRFASQQRYNVIVHLQTTNMHFERSAEEIAAAVPIQVLPDCCKPELPPLLNHRRVPSDGPSMKRATKRKPVPEGASQRGKFRVVCMARNQDEED